MVNLFNFSSLLPSLLETALPSQPCSTKEVLCHVFFKVE
jgi:hypothetical protein